MTYTVTELAQLEAIYDKPKAHVTLKEINFLSADYQAFIKVSPFVVLASVGPEGTDCSPKGDAAGFVQILDERTLALPDRLGNNRIDNLRNIIRDPRVSLLFLIPGVGETLRVNGRAEISIDPVLLAKFEVREKLPRTVIVIHVDSVYVHCSKAAVRSALWDPTQYVERASLPSLGAVFKNLSGGEFDAQKYDSELPARVQATLY